MSQTELPFDTAAPLPECDRCGRRSREARPVEGIRTRDPGAVEWRPFLSCCALHKPRRKGE